MKNHVIQLLDSTFVDSIIALQDLCWHCDNKIFTKSRRETYLLSFQADNFALGITNEQGLIGFVTCTVQDDMSPKNLGRELGFGIEKLNMVSHVNTILIHPAHRRKGLGNLLLQSALKRFVQPTKYILTTITPSNVPSRKLFEKNNFKLIKTFFINDDTKLLYGIGLVQDKEMEYVRPR